MNITEQILKKKWENAKPSFSQLDDDGDIVPLNTFEAIKALTEEQISTIYRVFKETFKSLDGNADCKVNKFTICITPTCATVKICISEKNHYANCYVFVKENGEMQCHDYNKIYVGEDCLKHGICNLKI